MMVDDCHWAGVCQGLVHAGLCTYIEESDVFCTDNGPLLNGLFGVSKDETTPEGVEVFRLIMNLIPLIRCAVPWLAMLIRCQPGVACPRSLFSRPNVFWSVLKTLSAFSIPCHYLRAG